MRDVIAASTHIKRCWATGPTIDGITNSCVGFSGVYFSFGFRSFAERAVEYWRCRWRTSACNRRGGLRAETKSHALHKPFFIFLSDCSGSSRRVSPPAPASEAGGTGLRVISVNVVQHSRDQRHRDGVGGCLGGTVQCFGILPLLYSRGVGLIESIRIPTLVW